MSVDDELAELVQLAEGIARGAGRLLVEGRHERLEARVPSSAKSSPTDLVTELDRASEAYIAGALARRCPDDALLGEEGTRRPGTSGRCWVVDPLDGTTNFVYGYGSYAVSIALTDADGSLVGVVHDPVREETFSARRGGGATLNGSALPAIGGAGELAVALVGTGFSYAASERIEQGALVASLLGKVRDLRRGGAAALDLCYVAAGRLDAYFEAALHLWDEAAGLLVATEAGCSERSLAGLVTDRATRVVARPALVDPLCALLVEAATRERGEQSR